MNAINFARNLYFAAEHTSAFAHRLSEEMGASRFTNNLEFYAHEGRDGETQVDLVFCIRLVRESGDGYALSIAFHEGALAQEHEKFADLAAAKIEQAHVTAAEHIKKGP
jgi:hypothetical protein